MAITFRKLHLVRMALACALFLFTASALAAQSTPPPSRADVVYGTADGKDLLLDIYMPPGVERPPLVVWIHGGAWRNGTKAQVPAIFVENGFATASLDFRQSTEARFPAAVHDIKAAIRFLRANADRYGYAVDRVAVAGSSSGAHYAALVGVTAGERALEGDIGDHLDQSSRVEAIVTILEQSTPFGLGVREPALELLLGSLPDADQELAELASPVFHVDSGDPPLLLLHGDQDPQMPINQAHELEGAYGKLGLDVTFHVVHGAAHGGSAFYESHARDEALAFLRRTLGR
jgi:acetyl esterase/lipase